MRALVFAIAMSLALLGCSSVKTIPQQDIPPAGTIWFGTAYDTTTFALTNQGGSFPAGSQVALVAHMNRAMSSERVTLYVLYDNFPVAVGYTDFVPGADTTAQLIPAFYTSAQGVVPVQAKDAGGNVLASGAVIITK